LACPRCQPSADEATLFLLRNIGNAGSGPARARARSRGGARGAGAPGRRAAAAPARVRDAASGRTAPMYRRVVAHPPLRHRRCPMLVAPASLHPPRCTRLFTRARARARTAHGVLSRPALYVCVCVCVCVCVRAQERAEPCHTSCVHSARQALVPKRRPRRAVTSAEHRRKRARAPADRARHPPRAPRTVTARACRRRARSLRNLAAACAECAWTCAPRAAPLATPVDARPPGARCTERSARRRPRLQRTGPRALTVIKPFTCRYSIIPTVI
jgi:hypothetical protein